MRSQLIRIEESFLDTGRVSRYVLHHDGGQTLCVHLMAGHEDDEERYID
jgi:hypothetical protein